LVGIAVVALGRDGSVTLRRIALVTSGGTAVLAGAIGVLWVSGGLPSAWEALVTYSAAYRSMPDRAGGGSVWSLVPWTILVLLPLVVGMGMAVTRRGRLSDAGLAWSAAAWLLVGLASIAVQGRFYAHYAQPLVIPMAVLAGLGIHAMWAPAPRRLRAAALGIPLLVGTAISLGVGAVGAQYEEGPIRASNERADAVAGEIRAMSGSDEAIFVWGNDARLYELADRRPATRYVYLYPLLTPGFATQEQISDMLTQMEATQPTIVVDSGSLEPGAPGLPPMLIARPVATDGRDLDLLDPVRAYVASRFGSERLVAGWAVYRVSR
jgi:hypothetical protein